MTMREQQLIEWAADVLDVSPETLSLDSAYAVLPAWDSVMHIRLVMEFGATFGVEIPFESIANIRTLRDFLPFLPED